ncbi:phosphonate metabolism transcriptional regulator PhnF [Oceanidesulfovibrio marinus]|uniref:Phosphonate metabolism transcriptional regulator PhnF n=1 Tax=Oceanidesulfovibrio marinus TaxID=370038 RepID=A0A6P1ZHM8_9BACT|nr:phosphonate metabolism transcriptional regulator PhnF [Oceanidesulfovibrio marinus]QJT10331.1 phosphonate metabolism transcriptional regulator PhnF [Oceanidesulfovibrio marinus]TVM32282.1 phosphonate metabolism transcriptional regulator PhnF [Oceanidesulfovibrio marinus]
MTLPRTAGVTLWRQIVLNLERDILSGAFAPGEKLPTEMELADRFRVNRHTVRRAMVVLQEKDLVRVEQGRGAFVQDHLIEYSVGKRTRFSENMALQNHLPGGTLLNKDVVESEGEMAQALQLPAGRKAVRMDILREADGRPIAIASHFFPLPRFTGIDEMFVQKSSITACLTEFGVADFTRVYTRITARPPTQEEAVILRQPRTRPLLVAKSLNVDTRGLPIDYGCTRYNSDRVQIALDKA